MATSSAVLFLLLAVFAAGASAATFRITNNCGFTVWPAGIPVGGGFQLNSKQSSNINVPAGTSAGRIWGRTGCSFNNGRGSCATGDCAGALSCTLSGQPATLAEYTIGGSQDFYDISVIDGYNLAMDFSCSTGVALKCRDSGCPDAYHHPNDVATHACNGNSNYQITFCP
uniref:Thaumatin-like pathogenesis-related protein 3 n=1 Tax=Avena sativa TaxID=4498 RepID=RST3_AVESA|nr:RecName: Full=Thaumatin-like pathogenesis-related protein 3; Flags: Precursor [Avena sativa]AAB09226.1 thaumatin-like pathogenesis-related protein [Avena sativa]